MKLGFIGAGNMATGIARGLAAARDEPGSPDLMLFADADAEKAGEVAAEVGGEALGSNAELVAAADMVLLAVKPNVLDAVAADVSGGGKPVISILAGTSLERLREALPDVPLVRVMPNLGAQLRQAVLCVAFEPDLGDSVRHDAEAVLALLGDVIEIEESLIDAATALVGCGPGYLALLAEVLVEAGVDEGLDADEALRMIALSMTATGGLLEHHHPADLRRAVSSPGGMTEAGLDAMEARDIREILKAAVDASLERVR